MKSQVRSTDGARMIEIAPHQFVNERWSPRRKRVAQEPPESNASLEEVEGE
jgi:hypothetical protein